MAAKILIDAISMSHPQPGGYRTYVTNLVQHLSLVDQRNEYVVAVDRPVSWKAQPRWELSVLSRRGSVGVIWREQVAIPRLASLKCVDLIHAPSVTAPLWSGQPVLVTLHDTIEFSEPLPSPRQTKRWAMRLYSRAVQRRVAQRALHVITVSDYSKKQLARFFSLPEERVTVIHHAPSPVFSLRDKDQAKRAANERWSLSEHVLGIASAAKRKNSGAMLDAYALLPESMKRKHPLVLVCTHPGVKTHISNLAQKVGLNKYVRLIENIGDADLALLYNTAAVFVFPSLEEGFGLPPLEAMACGAPVVASNTSSVPEVLGDAGILVTPTGAPEIADAINRVLTDQELAQELRDRGLARAAVFSWRKTAEETIAVYEKIAQS